MDGEALMFAIIATVALLAPPAIAYATGERDGKADLAATVCGAKDRVVRTDDGEFYCHFKDSLIPISYCLTER